MQQNSPVFIEKSAFNDPSEDFELLVAKGIELLQQLTGETWTDYNQHDPGVTILEQLCFAFTDLSYRTGFDIKDILSNEKGEICRDKNLFFDKKKILTTNAVTINDYRKVILDEVEEADNVDIVPLLSNYSSSYIRGMYDIRIKLRHDLAGQQKEDAGFMEGIESKIRKAFISKRNLGEDLIRRVVVLTPQRISIRAEILVKEFVHPEDALLSIFQNVREFLSPQLKFYSERELLEKHLRMENIYEGPLLKHGLVPDEALMPMKSEIDVFQLIGAVASSKEVLLVKSLMINGQAATGIEHSFLLDKQSFPVIDPDDFFDAVKIYAGDFKLSPSKKEFMALLSKADTLKQFERRVSRHTPDEEHISGGNYKNPGGYISIQDHFPHIYGLGEYGVYSYEGPDRKAKVKQLRAYIFFFEQILANYLAQLENISEFFSSDMEEKNARSFYFKPLYDIRGASEILAGTTDGQEWEAFKKNEHNPYMHCLRHEQETVSDYRRRKHKVFEHLYARFNELFITYPVKSYITHYGDIADSKEGLLLKWKANVLKHLAETEYFRVHAFNYLDTELSLGGFEKKMMRLLYISDERKKRLTTMFDGDTISIITEKGHHPADQSSPPEIRVVDLNHETLEIIQGQGHYHAYAFGREGISILKYGINYDNYRIVPAEHIGHAYIIIYKKPSQENWKTISYHRDKSSAIQALDKLIHYLMELSTASEGFHVVEHVLLRPMLYNEAFGFRFRINKDKIALKNHRWTGFLTREEVMHELVHTAVEDTSAADAQTISGPVYKDPQLVQEGKRLKEEMKAYLSNKVEVYPYFEMLVRQPSGKIIHEEFYNMRVTVALPSWPARFQDPEFRTFVENLFNSESPAHLCFQFLWLGVEKMKTFEAAYFPWVDALRSDSGIGETSEKLGQLIGSDTYLITQV
jgi:hypothetical protein